MKISPKSTKNLALKLLIIKKSITLTLNCTSTQRKLENEQRKSYRILTLSCWPTDIRLFDFYRKRGLGPVYSHYNQSRLWSTLHTTLTQTTRITPKWIYPEYTVLKNVSPFRIFAQLVLALKNGVCPDITVWNIYCIFNHSEFLSNATCVCLENRVCPENVQAGGTAVPATASYAYGHCTMNDPRCYGPGEQYGYESPTDCWWYALYVFGLSISDLQRFLNMWLCCEQEIVCNCNKTVAVAFSSKKYEQSPTPVVSLNGVGVKFAEQVQYLDVLLYASLTDCNDTKSKWNHSFVQQTISETPLLCALLQLKHSVSRVLPMYACQLWSGADLGRGGDLPPKTYKSNFFTMILYS